MHQNRPNWLIYKTIGNRAPQKKCVDFPANQRSVHVGSVLQAYCGPCTQPGLAYYFCAPKEYLKRTDAYLGRTGTGPLLDRFSGSLYLSYLHVLGLHYFLNHTTLSNGSTLSPIQRMVVLTFIAEGGRVALRKIMFYQI